MQPWKHFCTITKHRHAVIRHCFKAGIGWQGLGHDLSKYSPVEFWNSSRFYQGDRSPNDKERQVRGYSLSWLHHKGRNKHHFEYWTDLLPGTREYSPVPMPTPYLVEMVMDRRAACLVYQGEKYRDDSPLVYFERGLERQLMHPQTRQELEYILTMLAEKGEAETFRYLKEEVLAGKSFPWEEP